MTTDQHLIDRPGIRTAPIDPHHQRPWLILGVTASTRKCVITGYVLVFGSLLPLGGRLADLFGRKRMFSTGCSPLP